MTDRNPSSSTPAPRPAPQSAGRTRENADLQAALLQELTKTEGDKPRRRRGKGGKPGRPRKADQAVPAADVEPDAAERRRRPKPVPYEHIADWRGIETVLVDTRENTRQSPTTPGIVSAEPFPVEVAAPAIGVSPLDLVNRSIPDSIATDLPAAISSATQALRPYLERIVHSERRDQVAGKKVPTDETIAWYRETVESLFRQYCAQFGIAHGSDDIDLISLAEWLLSRRLDTKIGTWRNYRLALISHLERIPTEEAEYAISLVRTEDDEMAATASKETSTRVRHYDPDDFDRALYYSELKSTSARAHRMGDYMRANIRVGLRPWEFMTSELRFIPDAEAPFERQAWLFVCNAKFHEGRSNGPIRSINLSDLPNAAIEPIWRIIQDIRLQYEMIGYKSWLVGINKAMQNAICRRPGGRAPAYTSYSVRHQAISNWKSVYDRISVAALAGHAVPATAEEHYGPARYAWPRERLDQHLLVRPSEADIKRIEDRLAMHRQRRDMRAAITPDHDID